VRRVGVGGAGSVSPDQATAEHSPVALFVEDALMCTKCNPGSYDCYAKAEPDEPLFVLLARDPLAPVLVRAWADMKDLSGEYSYRLLEARSVATKMEQWRKTRPQSYDLPPTEIIEHALKLAQWFKDRNITEWQLGECQNRIL
jgi:hypothetical protein